MEPIELKSEMERVANQMTEMSMILKELSDSLRGSGFSGGGLINRMQNLEDRQTTMGATLGSLANEMREFETYKFKFMGGYLAVSLIIGLIAGVASLVFKFFGK